MRHAVELNCVQVNVVVLNASGKLQRLCEY
jgi:hypothetical protein